MKVLNISLANEGYTHKNWFYKNIYVNFSIIYYVIDGTAYYDGENGTVPLRKNHLYLFPVRKKFTLYDDPDDRLYHTYIHASTLPAIDSLIEIPLENAPFLTDAVAMLRKYISSGGENVRRALELVLSTVFDGSGKNEERAPDSAAFEIGKYIDARIEKGVTLDELCARFAYSKAQLNRIFRRAYGTSPIEYYNDKRLQLSVSYLVNGKISRDIAELLHYATPAAFCNAFKMKYGLPPSKYLEATRRTPK